MNEVVTAAVAQKRRVSFLLGFGIFFFPIVFGWFVFRKGHSTLARIVVLPWLILGVLGFVVTGTAIKQAFDQVNDSHAITAQSAQVSSKSPKAYTSSQVSQDYEANTVAADMLYKDKQVLVSGKITNINTDMFGDPYVVLVGTNQFVSPQFKFDKSQKEQIANLKKGGGLTVLCTGTGDVAKTPTFKDCSITN